MLNILSNSSIIYCVFNNLSTILLFGEEEVFLYILIRINRNPALCARFRVEQSGLLF